MAEGLDEFLREKIKKDFDDFVKYLNEVADTLLGNNVDGEVGSSKKTLIYENDIMELYSYNGLRKKPILIVNPLINGYYILDILPEISFTRFLIENEYSPYIIKWKNLKEYDKKYNMVYYVINGVKESVEKVVEIEKQNIVMIGHCLGGILASLYLSYTDNYLVDKYISMNSPYDFSKMGVVSFLTSPEFVNVDKLVDSLGNIPAEFQTLSFQLINTGVRFKSLMAILYNYKNKFFVRVYNALLKWRDDNIDMPGEFARELVKDFFQSNKFFNEELIFLNKKISLSSIKIPILNIVSQYDDIAPYSACDALSLKTNTDKIVLPDGHLAIVLMSMIGVDHKQYWEKILEWIKN